MNGKRILVTGANGFVGKRLCQVALGNGFQVVAALRNSDASLKEVEQIIVGNVDDSTQWQDALAGVDLVIHLAARVHIMQESASNPLEAFRKVNVLGTENLARSAVRAGVKRIVYVSSIKVNGEETTGQPSFQESDKPAPQDPYGISKWEAEQALHRISSETGLEVVIVRPPLVYGEGVKGNFGQLLAAVSKSYPLPLGSIRNMRSLVYVGNLADALITCANQPDAAGQTYLVSDGEDVSTPELIELLAGFMDVPSRVFPCHPGLLRLAGLLTGKSLQVDRLLGSLQVDSGKIRRELNWVPPFSLRKGLRATTWWYQNNT